MPTWNSNYPTGETLGSLIDNDIRNTKDYLEDALSREHEFPGIYGETAGKHKVGIPVVKQGTSIREGGLGVSENRLYTKRNGELIVISQISTYDIPVGTRMIFYQDTAPLGWSLVASYNDRLLYITKGSANGGVAGGSTGGSWTISGLSTTSHSHTVSLPHKHTVPFRFTTAFLYAWPWGTGDSGSHSYWAYGDSTSGSTQGYLSSESSPTASTSSVTVSVSHDGSWRPPSYTFIVAEFEGG